MISNPMVLAIPRGGVPVAFEVAKILNCPLDIIVPRKIPVPWEPEAGFGAVTEDGTIVLNKEMTAHLPLSKVQIKGPCPGVQREIKIMVKVY